MSSYFIPANLIITNWAWSATSLLKVQQTNVSALAAVKL